MSDDTARKRLAALRKVPARERSEEQASEILALEKAILAAKMARLSARESKMRDEDRKARTARLVRLGGLVAKAGIDTWDEATLLGGFQALARAIEHDPNKLATWKAEGGKMLVTRTSEERRPLIVSFPNGEPTPGIRKGLRALKLRWSDVRREWDGYADPAAVTALVGPVGGQVRQAGS